jgi:kynurenine 3-monooxygenase
MGKPDEERSVDAVVIGGGPCGLALAVGLLQQRGRSVLVIEKEALASLEKQDWSRAYSYRIDARGIRTMKRIGLDTQLFERGVRSQGFKGVKWLPDGTCERTPPRTLGSVGYWIQRPQLVRLLQGPIPEANMVEGTVDKIEYGDEHASVHVTTGVDGNTLLVKATHVFGCDGIHSLVRSSLCELDGDFQVKKVKDSLTAGLVYRATLLTTPHEFDPEDVNIIIGKSRCRFVLLPYCGEQGEARPMSCVNFPNYKFFQPKTAEELYQALEEEFPQLDIRKRMSVESATAWCESEGSVFPTPRWSGKAATVIKGNTVVMLVGDALHCFPPDLGQGVNAGMVDVNAVLGVMATLDEKRNNSASSVESEVASLNAEMVREAESVCRLIRIGMPYQYSLPHSLHKVGFFMDFMTRLALHKGSATIERWTRSWIPSLVTAPVIFQIQEDPPLEYSTILRNHHRNSLLIAAAATVGIGWMTFLRR